MENIFCWFYWMRLFCYCNNWSELASSVVRSDMFWACTRSFCVACTNRLYALEYFDRYTSSYVLSISPFARRPSSICVTFWMLCWLISAYGYEGWVTD